MARPSWPWNAESISKSTSRQRLGFHAEELRGLAVERRVLLRRRAEDLAEVLVNRRVVVDDQDALVAFSEQRQVG